MPGIRDQRPGTLALHGRRQYQGQRDDAGISRAGVDELGGVGDVLAHHQLGLHGCPDALVLQGLLATQAIGGVLGVGDGELADGAVGQVLKCHLRQFGLQTPQNDAPHRVGPGGTGRQALFLKLARVLDVSGEIHIEGRAILDLGEELA